MRQQKQVAIGLGSNLGDRLSLLTQAVQKLSSDFLEQAKTSSVFESEPWREMVQPKYLNAVVVGMCEWKPPAVLNYLQDLERALGRTSNERYAPRTIDLDLLCCGEDFWEQADLKVPHPYLAERDFVLAPLSEIWPDWKHPHLNLSVAQMWQAFQDTQSVSATVFAPPLLDR